MKGVTAIVARELQEWKRVFVAAFVAGLLAYLAPLLPVGRSHSAMSSVDLAAGVIAAAFGIAVAVIAGAGFIGRDLTERRLTFYFFKPLTAGSIWAGKLLAAILLATLSAIVALLPATLLGGGLFMAGSGASLSAAALLVAIIVAIVILANSFTLTLRARSKWVIADFAGIGMTAALVATAVYPLAQDAAVDLTRVLLVLSFFVLLLALLIGGLRGLQSGRTDLREVQRVHALTVWPICVLGAIALIGYSTWIRGAGPHDLDVFLEETAPAGPWIAISGQSPLRADYLPVFLTNVDHHESFRIGGSWMTAASFRFSRDGRNAVWLQPSGFTNASGTVMIATLGNRPGIHQTRISTIAQLTTLAISDTGSRVAVAAGRLLTVFDTGSERALVSVQIPEPKRSSDDPRIVFVAPDIVRVLVPSGDRTLEIFELNVDPRSLVRTGTIIWSAPAHFAISSVGTIVVGVEQADRIVLHDGRTGEQVGSIPRRGRVLSDGRVVTPVVLDGRGILHVSTVAGHGVSTIDLGTAGTIRMAGEVAPGKLAVATAPVEVKQPGEFHKISSLLLVDIQSGEVRRVAERLSPLAYLWRHEWQGEAGSAATKIFLSEDKRLVYFDLIRGVRRVIGGRGSS